MPSNVKPGRNSGTFTLPKRDPKPKMSAPELKRWHAQRELDEARHARTVARKTAAR